MAKKRVRYRDLLDRPTTRAAWGRSLRGSIVGHAAAWLALLLAVAILPAPPPPCGEAPVVWIELGGPPADEDSGTVGELERSVATAPPVPPTVAPVAPTDAAGLAGATAPPEIPDARTSLARTGAEAGDRHGSGPAAQLTNGGTVICGPGPWGIRVTVHTYRQTETGTLDVEIDAARALPAAPPFCIPKWAALSGTLAIHVAPGYEPPLGTTFEIVRTAALHGTFDRTSGLDAPIGDDGRRLEVRYEPTRVYLVVVSGP